MMEEILNIVRREVERGIARFSPWAVGTLTSYDGKSNGKVSLQPEGTETGWLPINAMSLSANFGPRLGASCLVHFQDGDREAGMILGYFYTDAEVPPPLAEDEFIMVTPWGAVVKVLKDGTIILFSGGSYFSIDADKTVTLTGKVGQTIVMDLSGNIILTPAAGGKVYLGGQEGSLPAARDTDSTVGNVVHATSAKVRIV